MLVLTRRRDEVIQIGPEISVTVVQIYNGRVKLGIDAPATYGIVRKELIPTLPVDGVTATQHERSIEDLGSACRAPKSVRNKYPKTAAETGVEVRQLADETPS